jgi:hypothetical protein
MGIHCDGERRMNEELRCFTFTLKQLNTMQQGIQAAHAVVELVRTHRKDGPVQEWADLWKTLILLDGGEYADLSKIQTLFMSTHNPFAWAAFHESYESLDGMMTSLAIVLPERIFKTAEVLRKKGAPEGYPMDFNMWELQMIDVLVDSRRAV